MWARFNWAHIETEAHNIVFPNVNLLFQIVVDGHAKSRKRTTMNRESSATKHGFKGISRETVDGSIAFPHPAVRVVTRRALALPLTGRVFPLTAGRGEKCTAE
jgi:hypothetical protein